MARRRFDLETFGGACTVFAAMVAAALTLDLIVPLFTADTFNMFYISPLYPCTLVILSDVYAAVPYAVFLLVYIFGFCLAAGIVFGAYRLAFSAGRRVRRTMRAAIR